MDQITMMQLENEKLQNELHQIRGNLEQQRSQNTILKGSLQVSQRCLVQLRVCRRR